jgi:hypothetical protein
LERSRRRSQLEEMNDRLPINPNSKRKENTYSIIWSNSFSFSASSFSTSASFSRRTVISSASLLVSGSYSEVLDGCYSQTRSTYQSWRVNHRCALVDLLVDHIESINRVFFCLVKLGLENLDSVQELRAIVSWSL